MGFNTAAFLHRKLPWISREALPSVNPKRWDCIAQTSYWIPMLCFSSPRKMDVFFLAFSGLLSEKIVAPTEDSFRWINEAMSISIYSNTWLALVWHWPLSNLSECLCNLMVYLNHSTLWHPNAKQGIAHSSYYLHALFSVHNESQEVLNVHQ